MLARIKTLLRSKCFELYTALVSLLMGGIFYVAPEMWGDDLWYGINIPVSNSTWEAFLLTFEESLEHLKFDTGRLANLLVALFLILPHWICALIYAASVWTMCIGCCNLAAIAYSHTEKSYYMWRYLTVAVLLLVLPWHEMMFCRVFMLNYIVASALMMLWLVPYIRMVYGENNKLNHGQLIWLFILGIIVGWWHEGISVPLLTALTVYLFVRRHEITSQEIWIAVSVLIGFIFNISAPAVWCRFGVFEPFLKYYTPIERFVQIAATHSIAILAAIILVLTLLKKGTYKQLMPRQWAFLAFLITFEVVTVVISERVFTGARVGWFGQLISASICLWCLNQLDPHPKIKLMKWGIIALALFIPVHLVAAIFAQRRYTAEFYDIVEQYVASTNGQVYVDLIPINFDLALFKTSARSFNGGSGLDEVSRYWGRSLKPKISIIPKALKDYAPGKGEPTDEPGVELYHNRLVSDHDLFDANSSFIAKEMDCHCLLKFVDGEVVSRFRLHPFTVGADTCWYIEPRHMRFMANRQLTGFKLLN